MKSGFFFYNRCTNYADGRARDTSSECMRAMFITSTTGREGDDGGGGDGSGSDNGTRTVAAAVRRRLIVKREDGGTTKKRTGVCNNVSAALVTSERNA